jgi:uncharacterized C2H2 Zn-finger protein
MSNNVKIVEGRRVWDKHSYVTKVNSREKQEKELETDEKRKESKPLEARKESDSLDLKNIVGKKYTVQSVDDVIMGTLNCPLCDVAFKDSNSLVEHNNSKYHLSKQGMTKQTVRSTLDDVKKRLAQRAPKKKEKKPKSSETGDQTSESTNQTRSEPFSCSNQVGL